MYTVQCTKGPNHPTEIRIRPCQTPRLFWKHTLRHTCSILQPAVNIPHARCKVPVASSRTNTARGECISPPGPGGISHVPLHSKARAIRTTERHGHSTPHRAVTHVQHVTHPKAASQMMRAQMVVAGRGYCSVRVRPGRYTDDERVILWNQSCATLAP